MIKFFTQAGHRLAQLALLATLAFFATGASAQVQFAPLHKPMEMREIKFTMGGSAGSELLDHAGKLFRNESSVAFENNTSAFTGRDKPTKFTAQLAMVMGASREARARNGEASLFSGDQMAFLTRYEQPRNGNPDRRFQLEASVTDMTGLTAMGDKASVGMARVGEAGFGIEVDKDEAKRNGYLAYSATEWGSASGSNTFIQIQKEFNARLGS